MGVGYGFFFVDDGVGGIEAVGGVVVVAGSEVVEVGGLFAFFVGELGFGGVVDGLTGLDFFAEGAVGGGIDDIAGIVCDDPGGIDLVGGVVEEFVGHGSVFGDQFGAGCLAMGEESMPPTNESSNVMVWDWLCKTVPPLRRWFYRKKSNSLAPVFVFLYRPNQRQNPEEGDQRPFMMEDFFPFIVLECFPGVDSYKIIKLDNDNATHQQHRQIQLLWNFELEKWKTYIPEKLSRESGAGEPKHKRAEQQGKQNKIQRAVGDFTRNEKKQ